MLLTDPIFTDAEAARAYLEATRWTDGVFCPHCGGPMIILHTFARGQPIRAPPQQARAP